MKLPPFHVIIAKIGKYLIYVTIALSVTSTILTGAALYIYLKQVFGIDLALEMVRYMFTGSANITLLTSSSGESTVLSTKDSLLLLVLTCLSLSLSATPLVPVCFVYGLKLHSATKRAFMTQQLRFRTYLLRSAIEVLIFIFTLFLALAAALSTYCAEGALVYMTRHNMLSNVDVLLTLLEVNRYVQVALTNCTATVLAYIITVIPLVAIAHGYIKKSPPLPPPLQRLLQELKT